MRPVQCILHLTNGKYPYKISLKFLFNLERLSAPWHKMQLGWIKGGTSEDDIWQISERKTLFFRLRGVISCLVWSGCSWSKRWSGPMGSGL